MKPHKIIQELKTKHLKELGLGLKFKAKGKLSDEARALMKTNKQALIEYFVIELYKADKRRKYLAELGTQPLNLTDIRLAIKTIDSGDVAMECYFKRWINNPTLYQGKLIECLEVVRREAKVSSSSNFKLAELTTLEEVA